MSLRASLDPQDEDYASCGVAGRAAYEGSCQMPDSLNGRLVAALVAVREDQYLAARLRLGFSSYRAIMDEDAASREGK